MDRNCCIILANEDQEKGKQKESKGLKFIVLVFLKSSKLGCTLPGDISLGRKCLLVLNTLAYFEKALNVVQGWSSAGHLHPLLKSHDHQSSLVVALVP
jgi:hypothetical protein